MRRLSPKTATVAKFGDYSRQCGQGLIMVVDVRTGPNGHLRNSTLIVAAQPLSTYVCVSKSESSSYKMYICIIYSHYSGVLWVLLLLSAKNHSRLQVTHRLTSKPRATYDGATTSTSTFLPPETQNLGS